MENELPHDFEKRMNHAAIFCNKYLEQIQTPIYSTICKFICFLCGGIITILSTIALYDENIILHVTLLNRNLVFYLVISSSIFYICHSFTEKVNDYNIQNDMNELLKILKSNDIEWETNLKSNKVITEISELFRFKIINLLAELYVIILLPYILVRWGL